MLYHIIIIIFKIIKDVFNKNSLLEISTYILQQLKRKIIRFRKLQFLLQTIQSSTTTTRPKIIFLCDKISYNSTYSKN